MDDDMIMKELDRIMSKNQVKRKARKAKKPDPKLWEKLFEENLRKEGYIR